jgi:hypothetical protein
MPPLAAFGVGDLNSVNYSVSGSKRSAPGFLASPMAPIFTPCGGGVEGACARDAALDTCTVALYREP